MKKAVKLLIVAIFVFAIATPIKAGIPDGAVLTKYFATTLKDPSQINVYNAENDLGNGIKAVMLLGNENQTYLAVYKVGSGKRDIYLWDGSQWAYQYSLSNIVPGFEEPQTLNSYKYATWSDYAVAIHKVDTGNENVVGEDVIDDGIDTMNNTSLTVTITGPTTGTIQQTTQPVLSSIDVEVVKVVNSVYSYDTYAIFTPDHAIYYYDPSTGQKLSSPQYISPDLLWDTMQQNVGKTTYFSGGMIEYIGNYTYQQVATGFTGSYKVSVSGTFLLRTVQWSVTPDGNITKTGIDTANITWSTKGTKTITAIVKDSLGNIVTKTLTVVVN